MVLSKQLPPSPDETLAENLVFRKKAINFIIVGHWTKNIGFCQNLSGRNVKIAFYVSLGKLWGEFFFRTINLIYHLRTSSELFCLFVEKLLDVVVITTICTSMGRFWWNLQFFQRNYFFYRFRTFTDVHHLSGKLFRQVCRKCNLRVHRNLLRRSFSLENFFVTIFITYWSRIFRPTVNFFDCVVKIAFYLYRKMFWARNNENFILFDLFWVLN